MAKADGKDGGTAVKLANGALDGLRSRVAVPRYERSRVKSGIVHIGVGGFHRAHQAVYVDDLLALPGAEAWGICGVGLRPNNRRMAEALLPQDCLYTVVERGAGSEMSARVIGAITDFMLAPDDPEAVLERMAAEEVRIVSLTITEGGYYVNQATGGLMHDHPDIAHDLGEPHRPVGTFGYPAEALDRRRS